MDYSKRSKHQKRIDEFMRNAKQELPNTPTIPSSEVRLLRARLIMEEAMETVQALGITLEFKTSSTSSCYDDIEFYDYNSIPNLELIADGCADLSVVTIGTLSACGINDCSLLETIDDNNLAKFGPGHTIREDGKLVKPPNHRPPDIEFVLKNQEWKKQ